MVSLCVSTCLHPSCVCVCFMLATNTVCGSVKFMHCCQAVSRAVRALSLVAACAKAALWFARRERFCVACCVAFTVCFAACLCVCAGIAYDAEGKRLFVTGKKWPRVFQIAQAKRPATKTLETVRAECHAHKRLSAFL